LTTISSDTISGRTEVIHDEQNVINTILRFVSNTKCKIDACVDYTRPSLAIGIKQLKKAFLDAKSRGVKLRYITEVTEENVGYCKELIRMVDELRHIEGINGNFYISETEYIAPASLHAKGRTSSQVIYSNVKEIVEHQQHYVFDSFWSRATPAQQRIREIEEGTIVHYKTRIIEDEDEIIKEIGRLTAESNELLTCVTPGGMQYSYNHFFEIKKNLLDKQKKGEHRGIKYVSNINNENLELSKIYLSAGIQIRHVKNLPPMSFGVSDKEISATIEKMEGGKKVQSLLTSNEPFYIKHFTAIFEELWNNGIDAANRISDIEEGVDVADIEVIHSSSKAKDLYLKTVKSAAEEILLILPTINAFIRQEKIGAVQLAQEAAKERDVKVRILMPAIRLAEDKVQILKEQKNISVRHIEQMSETKATILIVDRKASLVMEIRDDTKQTFLEAIGLSTYSNSKAGVLSYIAIFDNLWRQTELYEQLKVHDKMQNEFINIAAHELRTPIQPILGLSQVLCHELQDVYQIQLVDVILRNARRLQKLTEDILDITKIETQKLQLKKEQCNLNDIIKNCISDITSNNDSFKKNEKYNAIKLLYQPKDIFIQADRARITQVISNLLSNAVKFTSEGTISISLEQKTEEQGNGGNVVVIVVKDTGQSIHPDILPKLFTKFATKSETGTGLGLYISKSVVESHGGKIWAKNNADGKGAIFTFSLPVYKKDQ
jgi:two-component system, OmpR family, sensor histidine kinase VicK